MYATVSFVTRLTLSIVRFNKQTDKQTDKTNCLTYSRMRAWAKHTHTELDTNVGTSMADLDTSMGRAG